MGLHDEGAAVERRRTGVAPVDVEGAGRAMSQARSSAHQVSSAAGAALKQFRTRENVLGKPVGGDLREGKMTLPVIYALQSCTASRRRLLSTLTIRKLSFSRTSDVIS